MATRSPKVWTGKPPTGIGVQLSKVRPFKQLPWNAWFSGRIVRFCAGVDEAFAAVEYERTESPGITPNASPDFWHPVEGGGEAMKYLQERADD